MGGCVQRNLRRWTWVAGFALALCLSACKFPAVGYNQGYAPVQPIAYSHELHAGQYKIPCLYCHNTAAVSPHSAVPSLNICMNCHIQVKTDSPEIQKVQKAFNSNEPVAWVKVHMLPHFVYFNHERHVQHGFECQRCHGPIETMSRVEQHADLSMGWCVNCHRDNGAPTSCATCHR